MAVLHQSMCISKAGHSSLRHVRAECKDKKPDMSNFHQNIEVWCNSKLKLPKFKDLCIKNTEKVIQDNACTQEAIGFFTAKYEILQLYPNGLSFFYSEMQNFENCTQTAIRFSQQNKKFSNVPKLPFILWVQNKNFLKLFRSSHVLFDNKLKNLKLHLNCHSFYDDETQNLKSYPIRPLT